MRWNWMILGASFAACHGGPPPRPVEVSTAEAPVDEAAPTRPHLRPPPPVATVDGWFDPAPLLASLRPEARDETAKRVGPLDRLPLYDLDLFLSPKGGTFNLIEEAWITNREATPLQDLVLRIYANAPKPSQAPIAFEGGSCIQSACSVEAATPSVIVVHPAKPLAPNARIRVRLEMHGTLRAIDSSRTNLMAQGLEGLKGLTGSGESGGDYGILAVGDGIASLGNFYPVLARRRNGVWDRTEGEGQGDIGTDDMCHVHASVDVPAGTEMAVSGTIVADATTEGRRRLEVMSGAVRDFAVLGGADLGKSTRDVNGVTVRSYYLTRERGAGEKVLDVAATALAGFERRFGPYPYADLDVVEAALVGGAGGVEFAGLVTVASMFYRPATGTPHAPKKPAGTGTDEGGDEGAADEEGGMGALFAQLAGGAGGLQDMTDHMIEFVTAHEVAHQWWHGIVGSDSREHPVVDEALAQYSAILYLEDRYGAERAKKDGDSNVKANYQMMRMMGSPDGAADRPARGASSAVYAGLVYGKAPYFYVKLRQMLGDTAFFNGIRAYVDKYRMQIAPPRGVVDAVAAKGDARKVRKLAAHWLDEKHGDADLGKADIGSMLGGQLGGGAGGLDGDTMKKLMEGLGGGGAGGLDGDAMKKLMEGMGGGPE